jgi:kumamolisin
LLGVTVLVAAGDDGSDDRVGDGRAHVDFPASSPHVVGCGGTTVALAGSAISQEVVWNDGPGGGATGGGVSDVFALPAFQGASNVPHSANPNHRVGRGVPDISGDASPRSGYSVRVDGEDLVIGGTSAVAPLYAGLVALLNEKLGRPVGFLNPLLYGAPAVGVYSDIKSGTNGAYSAKAGWDACTGLGRVVGTGLFNALNGP